MNFNKHTLVIALATISVLTVTGSVVVSQGSRDEQSSAASNRHARTIRGVWRTVVTPRNCQTGTAGVRAFCVSGEGVCGRPRSPPRGRVPARFAGDCRRLPRRARSRRRGTVGQRSCVIRVDGPAARRLSSCRSGSAPAAWARSIARATRSSGATSRSRSCRAAFAADPDRLARFEREARVLASLNHPQHRARSTASKTADGRARARHGTGRGSRRSRERIARGPDSARRGAADRAADRRGARSRARAGHHPSRPEAREHQGHGPMARSRCSTSGWRRRSCRRRPAVPICRRSPTHDHGGDARRA